MANGLASISFDDINLDNCIEQGMEFTGYAKCKYCKQLYSFRIQLGKKRKNRKYKETTIDGEPATTLVPDAYDVSIEFSGNITAFDDSNISPEPDEPSVKPQCVPCSRCTPNCERVKV